MSVDAIRGLPDGRAAVLAGFRRGITPPPPMNVAVWAEESRWVAAESGSSRPGKWSNDFVPELTEIMECLSFTHPAPEVVLKKSAQVGGTECGLNMIGAVIDRSPCNVAVFLPSLASVSKYISQKLEPTIEATPALKAKVRDVKSRDDEGSTKAEKKFPGGRLTIGNAGASKDLQMISARVLILEEVSEYEADVGGRGDPVAQAESRTKGWSSRGVKRFYVSTPDAVGTCRITKKYDLSDQRRRYVPCPHCGMFQVLAWVNLRPPTASPNSVTQGAHFVCIANGCVIEQRHKRAMRAAGVWIKSYPPGPDEAETNPAPPPIIAPENIASWRARSSGARNPGFAWWQAYSSTVTWDQTVAEHEGAKDDPKKLKTFWQQGLGEAWEEKGEAPPAEKLVARREHRPPGVVPPGVIFLTAGVDVQGDRLEWSVYGWGLGLSAWAIEQGVIPGNPAESEVWRALEQVYLRSWLDAAGRSLPILAMGVDAGYLSQQVYRFAARHPPRGTDRGVFALDGRPGWRLPALGTPRPIAVVDYAGRKIGSAMLWPVGTYDLKSEIYASLDKTVIGPDARGQWPIGAYRFGEDVDQAFFEQLTAEHVRDDVKKGSGAVEKIWVKPAGRRNEKLDTAVYARALARHLSDRLTAAQWLDLAAQAAIPREAAQQDLAAIWTPGLSSDRAPSAQQDSSPRSPSAAAAPEQAPPPDEVAERRSEAAPLRPSGARPTATRSMGRVRPTYRRH